MSKIYEALQAHCACRVPESSPIVVAEWEHLHVPYRSLMRYRVEASLRAEVVLPISTFAATEAKERAWVILNEQVFGEYRQDIAALRQALARRDFHSAHAALDLLHTKMFAKP